MGFLFNTAQTHREPFSPGLVVDSIIFMAPV